MGARAGDSGLVLFLTTREELWAEVKCKKHTEERREDAASLESLWRGTVLFTVSGNSLVLLEGLRGPLTLSLLRGK